MENKNIAIFTSICDLVAKPEFQQDQLSFFNLNCVHFESEEENKLEYTTIYE